MMKGERMYRLNFEMLVIQLVAVVLAMSIHEMAHGLAAYFLGDSTAKARGRVSLNPLAHIDWLGIICLMFFGFGWAKPVPINPYNYKDPKSGMVWTAFAGPIANFVLSFVCVFLFTLIASISGSFAYSTIGSFILSLLSNTAVVSAGFGIFNLLPIPPLDGSRIFWAFLPDRDYYRVNNPPQWVTFAIFILIFSGLLSYPLSLMRSTLIGWMSSASTAIVGLFL